MSEKLTENKPLIGMKACATDKKSGKMGICDYVGFSEDTVLMWIRTMKFPARKLSGKWVSTVEDVNQFIRDHITTNE